MLQTLKSAAVPSARSPRKYARTAATAIAALALTSIAALPAAQAATDDSANQWSATVKSLSTGVRNGYQLAFDQANRKVYFSDAKWRVETRTIVYGLDGAAIGGFVTADAGTGKLVEFSAETKKQTATHSFTDLSRTDGSGKESAAFDWSTTDYPTNGAATQTKNSMRTSFSPYGIGVDGTTKDAEGNTDPTIVTTNARGQLSVGYGGNIVVYSASQGKPTDADRISAFDDGTPVFEGPRRVAVNTKTHQAFVTNLGDSRGSGGAGFVTVLDLTKRGIDAVQARIALPGKQESGKSVGVVGVAVDEETNTVYAGAMQTGVEGTQLWAIDANNLDTSDPKNRDLNESKVTRLEAEVGDNARPTYNAATKKVYVSSYAKKTITVVEADKSSANYGKTVKVIETGNTNSVEVDGERGLLYSANLGDREVVVYDINDDYNEVLRVPTSGNAVNLGVDPVTHEVWVSNFSEAAITDVLTINEPASRGEAPAVQTTTTVSVPAGTYGKAVTATVTVKAESGAAVSGNATVSVAGKSYTAKVANGKATVTLPATTAPGKYSVRASFAAATGFEASAGQATFTVAKGKVNKVTVAAKKLKAGKRGKLTVKVATAGQLAKATGKVQVTLAKGKASKKVTVKVAGGKGSVKLPKLAAGKWKVTAKYAGDANYVSAKAGKSTVKVAK